MNESDLAQLLDFEFADGDAQSVDLRKNHFTLAQGLGDALALPVQPTLIAVGVQNAFLEDQRVFTRDTPKTLHRTLHQHAVWAKHRTVGINANSPIGRAARVQPPHIFDHLSPEHRKLTRT
jgi:hypothetical protein